ncbi:hypothetical protein CR513_57557, partial [Mucuna pruriens]
MTILALTQYYDPPLRCFTFRDFQLAPTLEEYERLLGIPLGKSPPYLFWGHYSSWTSVVNVKAKKEPEWGKRYPKSDPGREALTATWRWRLVDLLVYGVILFLHIEDYVGLAAIDAFLGKRDRGESLVVAVLANTYYTLNYYHEKNGRGLRCCTSLLYLWMTAHLFHSKGRTECPIEDHN